MDTPKLPSLWRPSRWLTFEADWREMLFLHFEIAPEHLASHVPVPLDLREGKAYVSLVSFSFERLRPAGTGWLGRAICRPISEHPFLNVRTYVRGPEGTGIFFIAEWINNPISLRIGPITHGLPYRLGRFRSHARAPGGTAHLEIADRGGSHGTLRATYPSAKKASLVTALPGTLDDFLLERYRAYTAREGTIRTFEVNHEPWRFWPVDWVRLDLEMLHDAFPWFHHAHFVGAHRSPGLEDVTMQAPVKTAEGVAHSHVPTLSPAAARL